MLNASFTRDERAYYEAFEERGKLRHMLEEFKKSPKIQPPQIASPKPMPRLCANERCG
jgi:hypothetical protein